MMAVYDLEEQEQLDELKTWWKQHGNLVTSVMLAVAVAVAGWQGWTWWQRDQSIKASAVYAALQQAAGQRDGKRTRELAGELIDKYPRTAYAGMGALVSARVQIDTGDGKTAQAQLQWAADNAGDDAMRQLANVRLASVLLDEKDFDGALKRLEAAPAPSFLARHGELKGDIYAAKGQVAESRAAYEEALKALDSRSPVDSAGDAERGRNDAYREVLRAKLEHSGSGSAK